MIERFGAGLPSGGLSASVYYPTTGGQAKAGGWIANPGSYLSGQGDSWWSRYHVFSAEWSPSGLRVPHRRPGDLANELSGSPSGRST